MIRKIITIDKEKCNGCGLCADACHEGAIAMVAGKATLLREDYCDGLGDCLPACPMEAISFELREAPAYNEAAVMAAKKRKESQKGHGCPGSACRAVDAGALSSLGNFPVQIQLMPANAPCFTDADLLIAADCTAYAYSRFHEDFIENRITLIGCPKLDRANYAEKLTEIFRCNRIRSVTVTRMTVPCCGGLSHAVETAVNHSGKAIALHIVTIRPDGTIVR